MPLQEGLHFTLQGRVQHPLRALADQVIQGTAAIKPGAEGQHLKIQSIPRSPRAGTQLAHWT